VKAAQLAVGIDKKPNWRQLNLTQLRENKRKRPDRTCGCKRPRAEDVEIVPAGEADDEEVAELATVVQGSAATADVEPETDDACKECGEPEPPQSSKRQKTVAYSGCSVTDATAGSMSVARTWRKPPQKAHDFIAITVLTMTRTVELL